MIIDNFLMFLRKPRVLALILATLFSLLIYVTAQHIYRETANDPQIQIVEDTIEGLEAGMPANSISPAPGKTIDKGSSPFVVVYDDNANPVAGTSVYKGVLPKPPKGVFDYARQNGQNRLTWQPRDDLRFAIVVKPYKGPDASGFVMAARNLSEAESRVHEIGALILWAWAAAVLLIVLTSSRGMHHFRKIVGRKK